MHMYDQNRVKKKKKRHKKRARERSFDGDSSDWGQGKRAQRPGCRAGSRLKLYD